MMADMEAGNVVHIIFDMRFHKKYIYKPNKWPSQSLSHIYKISVFASKLRRFDVSAKISVFCGTVRYGRL